MIEQKSIDSVGFESSSGPLVGLEDNDVEPRVDQALCGSQSSKPRSDDNHIMDAYIMGACLMSRLRAGHSVSPSVGPATGVFLLLSFGFSK
jgi:hypothetical protein